MFRKNDDVTQVESLTVNVQTAAKMLGVCPKTVSNLTRRGELPVVRIAGCVRYCREDLKEFVNSKRETSSRVGIIVAD